MAEYNPSGGSQRASVLSHEQWKQVLKLCEELVELPSDERKAFLDSAGVSPEVAREVLTQLEEFSALSWPPANAGELFGKFEITGSLGRGGMGYVLSAQDTELNRRVALKFLSSDITMDPDATQKLLREAQTTSALNHPNIVTIHEVIRSGSSIAIVMELVEGHSRAGALREAAAGRRGCRNWTADRASLGRGPRQRYRASRHKAGKHHSASGRLCESPGLRTRAASLDLSRDTPVPASGPGHSVICRPSSRGANQLLPRATFFP